MAGESLQGHDRWRIVRLQILLFLFSLSVFLIAPVINVTDSRYAVLLSESLLHHRSAELDEHYKVPAPRLTGEAASRPAEANEYQLEKARGHVTYRYPHGSSMLSIPVVAAMNAMGVSAATADRRLDLWGEILIERVIASMLMAGLTCVFFATAIVKLPVSWSVVVAFGASMGSQILSTASRGLWAHTWELFLYGLIALSLLGAEHRNARIHAVWLGTLVAWIYFVRPTGAVAVVAVSLYVWWLHRGKFIAYSAMLTGWLVAFVGYWWSVFGTIIAPYYMASRLRFHSAPIALAINLISPSRGLLVFVPTTLFVVFLAVRYRRQLVYKELAVLALAQIVGLSILISANNTWTAGYSYGPRYFTDAIPWFVLLAILGLDAMRRVQVESHHRIEIAAAVFLLAVSVAINARGACSSAGLDWNPIEQPGAFDWRYPQFLAGLIDPPKN